MLPNSCNNNDYDNKKTAGQKETAITKIHIFLQFPERGRHYRLFHFFSLAYTSEHLLKGQSCKLSLSSMQILFIYLQHCNRSQNVKYILYVNSPAKVNSIRKKEGKKKAWLSVSMRWLWLHKVRL